MVFDPLKIPEIKPEMFESAYWKAEDAITGSAQGRGTTWFLKYQQQDWVLRHYYRGGLIGRLVNDSYLFTGQNNTRAAKEYALLQLLEELKLPAPSPVGFIVKRKGMIYQADILSTRIKNTQDLVTLLATKTLSNEVWFNIGEVIAKFHKFGIYHHDLNSHNILIDEENKVWLIDFDQGEQRTVNSSWQKSNLDRLLRSFNKEKASNARLNYSNENWETLLKGYNAN